MVRLSHKKIILFLLLFFLLIRLGVAIFLGGNIKHGGDASVYNNYATVVLHNNDWITKPDFISHWRAPFYPLFIAMIYVLFGINNYIAIYIIQAFLSTLTCFYIYKFSEKLFNKKIALACFIWSGLYILYLINVRLIMRETLTILIMIMLFYYLFLYLKEKNKVSKNLLFISVLYFVLIHADPRYIFYLPFFVFLFIVYDSFWRGVKKYLIFLSITILLMIPWSVRNYVAYNKFVLLTSHTSEYFHISILSNIFRNPNENETPEEIANQNYPTEEERELIKQGWNPNGRSADEIEAIKRDIYPTPSYFKRISFWFVEFWRPIRCKAEYTPYPFALFLGKWSLMHNLASLFCYGILLPFMLYGFIYMIKNKHKLCLFLAFPILVHTLLHILIGATYRYRLPIDAFIIIFAFYGIYKIYLPISRKLGYPRVE